mmetsp:Transcript_4648/g.14820  ORF Transcript_4648/g.14820 Transcript_4648/m.14820 type:complete len:334 (+) Transcript_4648:1186-2187(+)
MRQVRQGLRRVARELQRLRRGPDEDRAVVDAQRVHGLRPRRRERGLPAANIDAARGRADDRLRRPARAVRLPRLRDPDGRVRGGRDGPLRGARARREAPPAARGRRVARGAGAVPRRRRVVRADVRVGRARPRAAPRGGGDGVERAAVPIPAPPPVPPAAARARALAALPPGPALHEAPVFAAGLRTGRARRARGARRGGRGRRGVGRRGVGGARRRALRRRRAVRAELAADVRRRHDEPGRARPLGRFRLRLSHPGRRRRRGASARRRRRRRGRREGARGRRQKGAVELRARRRLLRVPEAGAAAGARRGVLPRLDRSIARLCPLAVGHSPL